jgi:DNA mismatch repair ATPase MutS
VWDSVILEAKEMLKLLEKEHNNIFGNQLSLGAFIPTLHPPESKDLWTSYWFWSTSEWHHKSEVEKELEKIDVNNLTPIEALNELVKLKGKL